MPGFQHLDKCPFCNAPWGNCGHARLFEEWEAEAAAREARLSKGDLKSNDCPEHLKPQSGGGSAR